VAKSAEVLKVFLDIIGVEDATQSKTGKKLSCRRVGVNQFKPPHLRWSSTSTRRWACSAFLLVRIHHVASVRERTPRYTNIVGVCGRVVDVANMWVRRRQLADQAGDDLGGVRCAAEGNVDTELLWHQSGGDMEDGVDVARESEACQRR
jgi:hypothetical protein